MVLSAELHKEIVEVLTSLPNIYDSASQRAFISQAGLDELKDQITFDRPPAQFVSLLVPTLRDYGTLANGRNALETVLEAAKSDVGQEKKRVLDNILRELREESPPKNPSSKYFTEHLPPIHDEFFGREKEEKILNDAWDKKRTNILCFYAWGGVGKTTLVQRWLSHRREHDDFQGATRVYGWSFYNQGTSEKRQTSSEQFLIHALVKWFGKSDIKSDPPRAKGERLADLICQERVLLILDGLEPLQEPVGGRHGCRLKDEGIKALLKKLANSNSGLCVITTRYKIPDIDSYGTVVEQKSLRDLSKKAGIELLTGLGVQGEKKELAKAVKKFNGHALTLSLLGTYLKEFHDGDIHQMKWISHLIDGEEGELARSVMKSYEEWLARYKLTDQSFKALHNENIPNNLLDKLEPLKAQIIRDKKDFLKAVHDHIDDHIGKEKTESYQTIILKHADWINNSPELIMLYLMGTFDRPAKKRALQRLYAEPIIKGLTEPLQDLRESDDKDDKIT